MKIRIFQYPLPMVGEPDELNQFLGSAKVATVSHHLASVAGGSMLVFVVEYIGSEVEKNAKRPESRIDYKQILSPEKFTVFDRLRGVRKRLAEEAGVPVYAVFTNAQLAAIVESEADSKAGLLAITGLGKERVNKYAEPILEIMKDSIGLEEGAKV